MAPPHVKDLPSAVDAVAHIAARLREGRPAIFLDFDGTLASITPDPSETHLSPAMRDAVERLRSLAPVAVVSGRDLDDVRSLVGVDGIHYAGSHGFDVLEADGRRHQKATGYRPDLDRAAQTLEEELGGVPGVFVERKGFALAVHYRQLQDPADESAVEAAVDRVVGDEPRLRKTGGKKIFEVRPDIEWDKGRAVDMMVELLRSDPEPIVPLYVGDDLTDEDALAAVAESGIGVMVRGEDDDRETAAGYSLEGIDDVREFLVRLADELGAPGSGRP